MPDYLLFIDTETSGLPVKWDAPYSTAGNWPYVVEIAWIIYTRAGQEIKIEDHYIKNTDFRITPEAQQIHGITPAFLQENGQDRHTVMQRLHQDLLQYQPLVIGHFMQLDYHMVGAEFYRTGQDNPLPQLPSFCTMLASTPYARNPRQKYLRLGNLYKVLLGHDLHLQHNALVDAKATAAVFFQMQKRGDINDNLIARQQIVASPVPAAADNKPGCSLPGLLFILFSILTAYWL